MFSVNLYQVQRINYFENLLTSSLTNTDYQEGNEMIKQNFNCNWLFSIGGNSLADPGRNQVVSVTVSHDAEIVRPRDP